MGEQLSRMLKGTSKNAIYGVIPFLTSSFTTVNSGVKKFGMPCLWGL
jgi:hypothetical protein